MGEINVKKVLLSLLLFVSILTIGGMLTLQAGATPGVIYYNTPRFFYYDLDEGVDRISVTVVVNDVPSGAADGPRYAGARLGVIAPEGHLVEIQQTPRLDFEYDSGEDFYYVTIEFVVDPSWFNLFSQPLNSPMGAYDTYVPLELEVFTINLVSGRQENIRAGRQTYIAAMGGDDSAGGWHDANYAPPFFEPGVTFGQTYMNPPLAGSGNHLHWVESYDDYGFTGNISASHQFTGSHGSYILMHYVYEAVAFAGGVPRPRDIRLYLWEDLFVEYEPRFTLTSEDVLLYQALNPLLYSVPSAIDNIEHWVTGFIPLPANGDYATLSSTPYMQRVINNGEIPRNQLSADALEAFTVGVGEGLWFGELDLGGVNVTPNDLVVSRSNFIIANEIRRSVGQMSHMPTQYPFGTTRQEVTPNQTVLLRSSFRIPVGVARVYDLSYIYSEPEGVNFWSDEPFNFESTVNRRFFPTVRDHTYDENWFDVPILVSYVYPNMTSFPHGMEDLIYPIRDMYTYRVYRPGFQTVPDSADQDSALPRFLSFIGFDTLGGLIGFTAFFLIALALVLIMAGVPAFVVGVILIIGVLALSSILNIPIWFPIIGVSVLLGGLLGVIRRGGVEA